MATKCETFKLFFLQIGQVCGRRPCKQRRSPPQLWHRPLSLWWTHRSNGVVWSFLSGMSPSTIHRTFFPSFPVQTLCPLYGAKTCTIPVTGCRQNHLLLIWCPQCEHLKPIFWFCVKMFGKFMTFWLGWKAPPAVVALSFPIATLRFSGLAMWLLVAVAGGLCGADVETNDCNVCHCLATLLIETPDDRGIALMKPSMYIKAVSTAACVTSSVKSRWLKARINSLLKRDCKLEFSEQLEASGVDSASVSTACPSSESTGARSQPTQRQTNLPRASPSISGCARSCSNLSSALMISCSRSCMSAFWYFPMLRCSFLPGIVSLALGESEPRLDASCMRLDSGTSSTAKSRFSSLAAQVKDSLPSVSRANFPFRMTVKPLVASVSGKYIGTTLMASS